MSGEFRFSDLGLMERVRRISTRRGDRAVTSTARDLIHERLLELEKDGDPAAVRPPESSDPAPLAQSTK